MIDCTSSCKTIFVFCGEYQAAITDIYSPIQGLCQSIAFICPMLFAVVLKIPSSFFFFSFFVFLPEPVFVLTLTLTARNPPQNPINIISNQKHNSNHNSRKRSSNLPENRLVQLHIPDIRRVHAQVARDEREGEEDCRDDSEDEDGFAVVFLDDFDALAYLLWYVH